tara:strand:- start:1053 stop:1466 length:414 start_codon:yes stop_codon:yes gene_type:complete
MAGSRKFSARGQAIARGYKSGLEDDNATLIKEKTGSVAYETKKIPWLDSKQRSYRPDFILPNGIIIETKGYFTAADRRKHVEVTKQHPDLDIRFVFTNPKTYYSKKTTANRKTYADWCQSNGYQYAAKLIPEEWFDE